MLIHESNAHAPCRKLATLMYIDQLTLQRHRNVRDLTRLRWLTRGGMKLFPQCIAIISIRN